ncbi:MAG: autotransporter domain-containing protein, partial [Janthinobacterium lividum]
FDAGLTGNVDFGSQANASVTLGANATLDGTVSGGDGNGTLNFAGSGATTGAIGSASASLAAVNIGTEATGTVAPAGDVYANTVNLQNGSTLDLVSGATLGGTLTTSANNSGTLNLAGNNTVTGDVGASGAALASVNVAGTAVSGSAETDFEGSVDTAQLNINQAAVLVDGTLHGNVGFSGAGLLALTQGMTGNIDIANQQAVVLVNAGQTIDGSVRSTGGVNGAVGFVTGGTVTGDLGSTDAGGGLAEVGVGLFGTGTLTVNGNVVASTVGLLNNSGLALGGATLNGDVVTTQDGTGALTLLGGTQTVNGAVGASGASLAALTAATAAADQSTFNGDVYANTTTLGAGTATFNGGLTTRTATLGSGTSTFNGAVLARSVSLADGSATFNGGLQARTTRVGSGQAVFNGTTQTNLDFTGAGTATLNAGLSGNVDFANQAATVNVADGQTLDGHVDNRGGSSASGGTLNFLGSGAVTHHVGSATAPLTALNIGTAGQGTVNAGGSLYVGTATLANDSTLVLAANRNLTGTLVTSADQSGALTLSGGTQSVNGDVGAAGAALRAVDASAASANTTFNGVVFAGTIGAAGGSGATASTTTFNGVTTGTLNFAGDGSVVLNGAGALTGTANFNGGAGALHIGDGVALTLDATHTQLANAGNATLSFDGDSVVTGVVGGASGSTPNAINAGANGKTVTFASDVSVGAGNLNVTGNGNVSLGGNLQGALAFAANGTVDVAAGKQVSGAVTTAAAGNGTLDFVGGTATQADIGTASNPLAALGFNTNGTAAALTLANNVYADSITLGANTTAALANNLAFGGNLTMSASGTSLDLAHYTLTGTSVSSGTGASSFALGSGTLKTTIVGGTAGSISADSFSNDAGAHVQVTVASGNNVITQGEQIKLADAAAGNTGATSLSAGNVSSTSAALSFQAVAGSDTGTLNAGGSGEDLYLVAQRTDYATAAGITNSPAAIAAAQALSAVAVPGALAGASADMHTVLGTLDSYNASQLATQVRRLAPIANGALLQSTLASSDAALANVNSRLQALRENAVAGGTSGTANGGADADGAGRLYANGQATPYSVWIKGYGYGLSQSGTDGYDGYSATLGGAALGADVAWQQGGAGLSIGHSVASIDGKGYTDADNARVRSDRVTGYLTQGFGAAFVESQISYGNDKFDTTRLSALNRTASGSFNGSDFSAKLGTGLQLPVGARSVFTPIASVEATTVHQDSYTESGADALDLAVDSKSNTRVRMSLGGRFSTATSVGAGVALLPEVHAFVNHDLGNLSTDVTARYVGGGGYFVTPGLHLARTSVDFGAGLSVGFTRAFSLQIEADVEARSNYTSYGGQVVARGQF